MYTQNVTPLDSRRGQLDYRTLRIYDELLGPAPLEGEGPVLRLTEEGLAYYGLWFRKFGFSLTNDANEFFETIKFIARTLREGQFPEDADSIVPAAVAHELAPSSRELAQSLNTAVQTGRLPADWSERREAACQERQAAQLRSADVLAFPRK